jgi:putative membrane protein
MSPSPRRVVESIIRAGVGTSSVRHHPSTNLHRTSAAFTLLLVDAEDIEKEVPMMYWSDPGWLGWTVMTVGMVAFWVLIAVAIAALIGAGRRDSTTPQRHPEDARRVLDERFARGEIDEDDYHHRRELLSH